MTPTRTSASTSGHHVAGHPYVGAAKSSIASIRPIDRHVESAASIGRRRPVERTEVRKAEIVRKDRRRVSGEVDENPGRSGTTSIRGESEIRHRLNLVHHAPVIGQSRFAGLAVLLVSQPCRGGGAMRSLGFASLDPS